MCPAGLYDACIRFVKVGKRPSQEIMLRHKIRIKDGDEFTPGRILCLFEGTGFKAFPVGSVV